MRILKFITINIIFTAIVLQPSYGWWSKSKSIENETCALAINKIPNYCKSKYYSELKEIKEDLKDKGFSFSGPNNIKEDSLSFVVEDTKRRGNLLEVDMIFQSLKNYLPIKTFSREKVVVGNSFFRSHHQTLEHKTKILQVMVCEAIVDFLNNMPYCEKSHHQDI